MNEPRDEAIEIVGGYAFGPLGQSLDYTPILELAKRARLWMKRKQWSPWSAPVSG